MSSVLKISNLVVEIDHKTVINDLSLDIGPGELHVIMGPNGSGKSTLSNVLAGKGGFSITSGSIEFKGQNLLDMKVEERARSGLFLAFQYPAEIPGVMIMSFLKAAFEAINKARGNKELTPGQFLALVKAKAEFLSFRPELLQRSLNQGFSGGEKKLFEALQMLLLEPEFVMLDETDSGLDVDALRKVVGAVNYLRDKSSRSWIIITHYQNLLSYIKPDYVHIMCSGRITRSGQMELLQEIETNGFEKICC